MRDKNGRFLPGNIKIGGFVKGSVATQETKQRISDAQRGLIGSKAKRWKGNQAGYVARHMWIAKHYGKAMQCENDSKHTSSRFEWANISGEYRRDRDDYRQLCKRCHIEFDRKNTCYKGHEYTIENTHTNIRGHRRCITCWNNRKELNATAN